jgi:hypothetical protein
MGDRRKAIQQHRELLKLDKDLAKTLYESISK